MGADWIILIIVIGAAVWLSRGATGQARKKRYRAMHDGTPVCGACGYPADPRNVDQCAECGAPYAHAGTLTPALALRMGPPFALIAIFILFVSVVIGVMASSAVGAAFNLASHGTANVGYVKKHQDYEPITTPILNGTPRPYTVRVTHEGPSTMNGMHMLSGHGRVTFEFIQGALSSNTVIHDLQAGTWELRTASGAIVLNGTAADFSDGVAGLFDSSLLRGSKAANSWMGYAYEVGDARLIAIAALQGFPAILSSRQNQHGLRPTGSGTSFTTSASPVGGTSSSREILQLIAIVISVAIGIALIALLYRKHRRILACAPA